VGFLLGAHMNISDKNEGTPIHDEDELAIHGLYWHIISGYDPGKYELCLIMREPGDDIECFYFECEYDPATKLEYVYFLEFDGLIKIGRTNEIKRRHKQLDSVLPYETTLIHSIQTNRPKMVEKRLHNMYRERRGKGEWFSLTPTELWQHMFYRKIIFYEQA
jgi:hypothetical protein